MSTEEQPPDLFLAEGVKTLRHLDLAGHEAETACGGALALGD